MPQWKPVRPSMRPSHGLGAGCDLGGDWCWGLVLPGQVPVLPVLPVSADIAGSRHQQVGQPVSRGQKFGNYAHRHSGARLDGALGYARPHRALPRPDRGLTGPDASDCTVGSIPNLLGQRLKYQVLFQGKPLVGAHLINDFINDPDAKRWLPAPSPCPFVIKD
jgi:hypothetical protein